MEDQSQRGCLENLWHATHLVVGRALQSLHELLQLVRVYGRHLIGFANVSRSSYYIRATAPLCGLPRFLSDLL